MIPTLRALLAALALCFCASAACPQATVLQGGTWSPGHVPMYSNPNFGSPIVQDGGAASGCGAYGCGIGSNPSEMGLVARSPTNTYPAVNAGSGPDGAQFCLYDAPVTNATGYHYLCLGPNSLGGGLLAYGAGGSATPLGLNILVNGVPFSAGGGGGGAPSFPGIAWLETSSIPAGTIATTGYSTYQTAINQASTIGGAFVNVPSGTSALITAPIDLLKGTWLVGSVPCTPTDTNAPLLDCSRIRAGANMAAVVTQSNNIDNPQASMGIVGMTLDGNASNGITVPAVVNWEPLESFMDRDYITNGSGDCVDWITVTNPAWLNWITNSFIGTCAGVGVNIINGSDSRIVDNDIGGSGTNIKIQSTGAVIVGFNQIDVAAQDGLQLLNSTFGAEYASPVVGNYFSQNIRSDVHLSVGGGSSFNSMQSSFVGNTHHDSSGYLIDSSVSDGVVIGDAFGQSNYGGPTITAGAFTVGFFYTIKTRGTTDFTTIGAASNAVGSTFTATGVGAGTGTAVQASDFNFGSSDTAWQIIGTSHTLPPSQRFYNLPNDTAVLSGGDGGWFGRLPSLVLAAPSSADAKAADATLDVFGIATVLGQGGVIARMGAARNSSGFDPAILIGSGTGNTPFVGCFSGETTSLNGCDFYFQAIHGGSITTAWSISASAMTLGETLGLPPATWTDTQTCAAGQISVDASFIYVCTATNTVKRAAISSF